MCLLQLVENLSELVLLGLDRQSGLCIAMGPVDASDGGEPYRSDLMFRTLCLQGQRQATAHDDGYNSFQNSSFFKISCKVRIFFPYFK